MKKFIKSKLSDELLRHSGILFLTTILAGVCNFLFQIFMNHGLSSSGFATLYTLLAVTMIASIPGMSIQTVMTKQTSHLKAKNETDKIAAAALKFLTRVLLISGAALLVIFIFSPKIAAYLKIESINPILIVGLIISLSLILPVGYGILQGLQDFKFLGISMTFFTLSRLLVALLFVFVFHFGVSGALASSIIAFIAACVWIFAALKKELKVDNIPEVSAEKMESFMWVSLVTFTFMYLLSFVDIILVKHFFSPEQSAQYSAASLLGRAVFYFPWAISGAMFPKVSFAHSRGEDTTIFLKRSLKYSFLLSIFPAACFLFVPGVFLGILKPEYLNSAYLLKIFGVTLLPLVLLTVLVYYNLAICNKRIMVALGIGTIFHLFVLNAFHHSLLQVIIAIGASGLIILMGTLLITPIRMKRAGNTRASNRDHSLKKREEKNVTV
ncbi:MAG: polysaccharide biosynthesis C-terminal domain-containing protein [Candidatus Omnitrophota bacterium]